MLKVSSCTLAAAVLTLFVCASVQAQSIVTTAGGGTTDGQLATNIPMNTPRGIGSDRAGNVYVVVSGSGQVLRIDATTGRVITVAGKGASGFSGDGGPAINATLREPHGITLDAAGNIYVADTGNNRVRRIDAASGIITTYAGGGTRESGIGDGRAATAAFVGTPRDVAIARGFLYITEAEYDGHRVRRVDMATGIITTIAGKTDGSTGGFGGDGGPAAAATLYTPDGIVADESGNIFFVDSGNGRIRRIDANGVITTYAGPFDSEVRVLALDGAGSLTFAFASELRRIDRATQLTSTVSKTPGLVYGLEVDSRGTIYFSDYVFSTVLRLAPGASEPVLLAGGGRFIGDGGPATAAILQSPQGIATDKAGNIFIADSGNNVVRRVSAADGSVSTVAGTIGLAYSFSQEGQPAAKATIGFPRDLAIDSAGNLYIADPLNQRVWRVTTDGLIRTFAGGGNPADSIGDNGPAVGALIHPRGIGLDLEGNLFIADTNPFADVPHHRIRRVDGRTGMITTVAGGTAAGFAGDGGAAAQALLDSPTDVAVDNDGNIVIADTANGSLRRVDRAGIITTIAGRPDRDEGGPLGDDGPASAARLRPFQIEIHRPTGDLYLIDFSSHRVRKIDARTSIITTVAGSDFFYLEGDFAGDNGPARAAKLHFDDGDQAGLAFSPSGDLHISDSANNRIRTVLACGAVEAPVLAKPSEGSSTSTAPELTWSRAARALRFDVYIDTVSPPARLIGNDVSGTSFTTSNLQPSTRYFWRVVAKADPFCPPLSSPSAVGSFTTSGVCAAAPFNLTGPADGATVVAPAALSWQASAGAGSYDVYLGTTSPPPLFARGVSGTSLAPSLPSGRYFWFVVARAACDDAQTATTTVRSFELTGGLSCTPGELRVTTSAPASGAAGVATTVNLTWSSTGQATGFDVYLGTTAEPPLLTANVTTRELEVPGLRPATTYYWRIVAKGPCDPNGVTSATASFTTRSCAAPGVVTIVFAPATVSAGTTYTIVWSPAAGLDSDGGYLVERSTDSNFSSALVSQVVSTTAASFDAEETGTYFHRVRAIAGCDPTRTGPPSAVRSVNVTAARPNVVFTVQPKAEITALGEALAERRGTFALENLGRTPLQVIVGRQELSGSTPFFTIFDPIGGDSAFVTLEPRRPRLFQIRYSGPADDVPATYQGVIFVASTGEGLSVTPYAFVNLKIGAGETVAPQVLIQGTQVAHAAFPPHAGDDANRPPLEIIVRNPGTSPMDLAAEIGPEVWLALEAGWNSTPLAPGTSRTVKLFTRRGRAPNGSALPRYTYLTLRTRGGASTRLLVQDDDDVSVVAGRTIRLAPSDRSLIVPEVVSRAGSAGVTASTIRLSNIGNDRVQVEVLFTPAGADGFDATVRRAVVVVPPNDVASLTDPLVQLFRLARPQSGQIEVRVPRERQGLLQVTSSIGVPGLGAASAVPVVPRGEGARTAIDHTISGIRNDATTTTALTLAETTGTEATTVRLTLVSESGAVLGNTTVDVPRYGYRRFDNIASVFGGTPVIDGGRILMVSERGAGAVTGVAFVGQASTVSVAVNPTSTATMLARRMEGHAISSVTTVVPVIQTATAAGTTRTRMGLVAPFGSSANFSAVFRNAAGGAPITRQIPVPSSATLVIRNIFEFFGVADTSPGTVSIETPTASKVYAVLETVNAAGTSSTPTGYFPLPTSLSEAITSAGASGQRPLFYDGLEQSTDPARGTRWMLLLNEVAGSGGVVTVRLFEAANRSVPIAQRDFTIGPNQQVALDTVFRELDLDSSERRKDRTNVLVMVTARSGTARVAATAISTDNLTGGVNAFALVPSAGGGTPGINLVTPVTTAPPASPAKRRAVRR